MLKMQGTIKGVKVSISQNGMSRQVTFDIGGDSILDDLQEIMRSRAKLNISVEKQQLEIGSQPAGLNGKLAASINGDVL